MRVLIDEEGLEEGAADWWRRISPAARAVLIQALWECGHGADERENDHEAAIITQNNAARVRDTRKDERWIAR